MWDIIPTKHPTVVSPALRIYHPIPTFSTFVPSSLRNCPNSLILSNPLPPPPLVRIPSVI